MYTPQAGIFALGTSSHAYLEFDILDAKERKEFASAISGIREPRTTTGGVNFVIGFRPELWREMVPEDAPPDLEGFNHEIRGTDGFVMPSTQHDAVVWLSGSAYDVIFDMARSVVRDLAGKASLGEETSSWPYRHDRDLTGFIDGSENPTLLDAPSHALLPEGGPGAAGTILLLQKWKHKVADWEALSIDKQEHIMGRTKVDTGFLDPLILIDPSNPDASAYTIIVSPGVTNGPITPTPEPSTSSFMLIGIGLIGLMMIRKRIARELPQSS